MGNTIVIGKPPGGGAGTFKELLDGFDYATHGDKVVGIKSDGTTLEPKVNSASVAYGAITGTLSDQTDLQTALNGKQATLVSGTNIKTINSNTILGSGDIAISGSVSDGNKGDITVSGSGATWNINNDAVTTAKILNANVTDSKLANDSVTTAKILNANVTADKLASDSVITAKILNSNVTLAKLENIATSHFLGRHASGSGGVQQVSASQGRTILNVADGADVTTLDKIITQLNTIPDVAEGDILYRNNTGWVRLARGSNGQVLKATASTIEWADESGGGGGHTRDATLTQATSAFDIGGKDVRITLSSGTSGSLNTFIDMATVNYEGNRVEILNSTGGNYTITTTSLSNFIGGSYIIPAGGQAVFYLTRNLLTTTFDQDTHIYVGNAGAYS